MKKMIVLILVVCTLLCACTAASQRVPQNVGKPIENESTPTGSSGAATTNSTGASIVESTGAPATQGTQPATQASVPATTIPASTGATTAPVTNPVATNPPATNPPATSAQHTHQYVEKITQPATCEDLGVKTFTCACTASYREAIPATGHSWGQWIETKIATAAEMGEQVRTCNNCDEVQSQRTSKMSYDGSYFYNRDNYAPQAGEVAIKPRCVFWNGGNLYVEAFLINGTNSTVRVNKISWLRISNAAVNLAYAENFSNSGAILAPGAYSTVYLRFGADQIANYGAGLETLSFAWSLDLS